jgi:hypothetical protein
MRIYLRRVIFVAQTIIETQVFGNLPRILPEEIQLMGSDAIDRARKLVVVIGEAADEIGQGAARIRVVASKVERSIVIEVVMEVVPYPTDIGSKLQSVASPGPGKSILVLKSYVVNLGRSLRGGSEVECTPD